MLLKLPACKIYITKTNNNNLTHFTNAHEKSVSLTTCTSKPRAEHMEVRVPQLELALLAQSFLVVRYPIIHYNKL